MMARLAFAVSMAIPFDCYLMTKSLRSATFGPEKMPGGVFGTANERRPNRRVTFHAGLSNIIVKAEWSWSMAR
jgi:hypothetical protein